MNYYQQSSLFDGFSGNPLFMCEVQGNYVAASDEMIIEAAKEIIERKMTRGKQLNSPEIVKEYLRSQLSALDHEVFMVLYVDTQMRLIDHHILFRGTINSTSVYPRELLKEVLKRNAAGVFIAHNHPSGHAEPSVADMNLTKIIKKLLGYCDVKVHDHIIIAGNDGVSLAERGLL